MVILDDLTNFDDHEASPPVQTKSPPPLQTTGKGKSNNVYVYTSAAQYLGWLPEMFYKLRVYAIVCSW